jgi:hypothetical protein
MNKERVYFVGHLLQELFSVISGLVTLLIRNDLAILDIAL